VSVLARSTVEGGVTHLTADDDAGAGRIDAARLKGGTVGLRHAINLHEGEWEGASGMATRAN
jgi:hypothetical protein